MEHQYREGLTPIPRRISRLPIERGYPVPWFVAKVDGKYDFRVVDGAKFKPAITEGKCWICGQALGRYRTFTIGPMCAINRTISEPPAHTECAEWSAINCPFLNQTEIRRNESNLPADTQEPAGVMIRRQPGAVILWTTKSYRVFSDGKGILFRIGDPLYIKCMRQGRDATFEEMKQSIDSGLPILMEEAEKDGEAAVNELAKRHVVAMELIKYSMGWPELSR